MKADEWRKSCGEDDAILSACIDDLTESEREAGILRDALAESERLREKAGSAILAMSSSLDLAIEKAEEFRNARDKAEELVAALKKAIAQSSTQYREMVAELDDLMLYYTIKHDGWRSEGLDILAGVVARIEARRNAEGGTP